MKNIDDLSEYQMQISRAILTWFKLAYGEDKMPSNFYADLAHSALLRRLLEGKSPLPDPPPCYRSYPWYDLIEDGHAEKVSVSITEDSININGNIDWKIESMSLSSQTKKPIYTVSFNKLVCLLTQEEDESWKIKVLNYG